VKNPPKQVPQLGKDGFYSNVKNRTGQLWEDLLVSKFR
jgi:hypothetical protein